MRNLAFWGLFPFALPQAIWVRRTAQRFAPAVGPTSGTHGDGAPLRMLALGDSIIAGVGAQRVESALVWQTSAALARQLERRVDWTALGRIGAKSATVLPRFHAAAGDAAFDVVLLSVGVNDITSLTSQPAWRTNLRELFERILDHSPRSVVAVAGIPPLQGFPLLPQPLKFAAGQRGKAFDSVLRTVAAEYDQVLHVPVRFPAERERFSADGFHPSEGSYADFAQVFAQQIAAALR